MSQPQSINGVIDQFRDELASAGIDDALRDARLIFCHVMGIRPLDIVTNPRVVVGQEEYEAAWALLLRRLKGESIHRVIGHREFYNIDLMLSAETLEPRPDTEILVEALLPYLKRFAENGSAKVLDLGTGTGAICLSLLAAEERAIGTGVDISDDALATSLRNAAHNGVAARYRAVKSDWFANVDGQFDVIVSNPPYIRSDVIPSLDVIVRGFDPMAALDGGPDGLEPYRIIAKEAKPYLRPGGVIGVEIGYDQKVDVTCIFAESGFKQLDSFVDYGGNDRAILFTAAE
jgi:release factor glutamine methyltransferase